MRTSALGVGILAIERKRGDRLVNRTHAPGHGIGCAGEIVRCIDVVGPGDLRPVVAQPGHDREPLTELQPVLCKDGELVDIVRVARPSGSGGLIDERQGKADS